ncbi:hypothetical protein [Streptomyces buecherae]|uniref:hypothetical protein n=1 Tax=Streptomyces buecherae TaxID=2763006 RepID=UPI0036BECD1F
MGEGIQWLADEWGRSDLNVTFARRISPRDLAIRLGADPVAPLQPLTAYHAEAMLQGGECARVARVGQSGEWSYAVEPLCPSRAWWGKPELSMGGLEVLHLTPKSYDPPKEFWYYRDGVTLGRFDFGEQPGELEFLAPSLEAEGALNVRGPNGLYARVDDEARKILAALERHFGLSLPYEDIVHGTLPGVVTAMTPPENLGD